MEYRTLGKSGIKKFRVFLKCKDFIRQEIDHFVKQNADFLIYTGVFPGADGIPAFFKRPAKLLHPFLQSCSFHIMIQCR